MLHHPWGAIASLFESIRAALNFRCRRRTKWFLRRHRNCVGNGYLNLMPNFCCIAVLLLPPAVMAVAPGPGPAVAVLFLPPMLIAVFRPMLLSLNGLLTGNVI